MRPTDREAPGHSPLSEPILTPCEERDAADIEPDEFQERFVATATPLVIRGAMDDWPALTRWANPDYLQTVFDEKDVSVFIQDKDGDHNGYISIQEYWRGAWEGTGDRHYYMFGPIITQGKPGLLGEVKDDIVTPRLFGSQELITSKIFGGWQTRCGVHYHAMEEAMLCQVVGRKRLIMFSPEGRQFYDLYPKHFLSTHFTFSHIRFPRNGEWPPLDKFPRVLRTQPLEVFLEPGDMLYIPVYWWHLAFGFGTSISVANFWNASFRKRYLSRVGLRTNYINGDSVRKRFQRFSRAEN